MDLIIGATGFLGRYLQAHLLRQGRPVRCLIRRPTDVERLAMPTDQTVLGDVLQPETLRPALEDVEVVYYLVHAMRQTANELESLERQGIENLIRVAGSMDLDLQRLVFVSGLASDRFAPTAHLRGRFEVEEAIRHSGLPYTIFRAGMIVGWESLPFQVLYRTARYLPVIAELKWLETRNQPIHVRDLLFYLSGCLHVEATCHRTFDLGHPTVSTYGELLRQLQELLGREALFIPSPPVKGVGLTAQYVHRVANIPLHMAEVLAESLFVDLVCRERSIDQTMPRKLRTFEEACLVELVARGPGRARVAVPSP